MNAILEAPRTSTPDVDLLLAKARVEQQNNAAYRALLDANERLIQQVFDLASLYKSEPDAESVSVPGTSEDAGMEAIAEEPASETHAIDHSTRSVGACLRAAKLNHWSQDYHRLKDEMLQAVIRNYRGLDGSMTLSQCAAYLGTSNSTVCRYSSLAKQLRAQHRVN